MKKARLTASSKKSADDEATPPVRGDLELLLAGQGLSVCGVDEVGRGCLAGPVFAACVAVDTQLVVAAPEAERKLWRDSKTLSAAQRARILPAIEASASVHAVASATVEEIDKLGIVDATFLAMRRAIAACGRTFDIVLVDGHQPIRGYEGRQMPIVKGDNSCYAIAAASILAKEARDGFMREQDLTFPGYGFTDHVGYGTAAHMAMIDQLGVCELHRRSFAPIRSRIDAAAAAAASKVRRNLSAQPAAATRRH